MSREEKKPRIRVLGEHGMEDVPWDSIPDPDPIAFELAHYFIPPRIAPKAIDLASKIIPAEYITKHGGVHSFLQKRATEVFAKMPASDRSGIYGKIKYVFDFDKDGAILKTIGLV